MNDIKASYGSKHQWKEWKESEDLCKLVRLVAFVVQEMSVIVGKWKGKCCKEVLCNGFSCVIYIYGKDGMCVSLLYCIVKGL